MSKGLSSIFTTLLRTSQSVINSLNSILIAGYPASYLYSKPFPVINGKVIRQLAFNEIVTVSIGLELLSDSVSLLKPA